MENPGQTTLQPNDVLARAEALRHSLSAGFRDETVKSIYNEAERIAQRAVHTGDERRWDLDQRIDRLVTSPVFGLPIMLLLLAIVFWLTIVATNVPPECSPLRCFGSASKARNCSPLWAFHGGSPALSGMASIVV